MTLDEDRPFSSAELADVYVLEPIDMGKLVPEVIGQLSGPGAHAQDAPPPPPPPEDFVSYRDMPAELGLLELRMAVLIPKVISMAIRDGVEVPDIEDSCTLIIGR